MCNFYVDLAGHDMDGDAGRTTTCRRKIKPQDNKHKLWKTKDLPKTWGFNGEKFEDFRRKKTKHYSRPFKKTQRNTRPLNAIIEYGPCNQEEANDKNWKNHSA